MSSDPFAGLAQYEDESTKADPFKNLSRYQTDEQPSSDQQQQEPEEGLLRSAGRYIAQPVLGRALAIPGVAIPAVLGQVATEFGGAEAEQELGELQERLPELQKKFPQAPWKGKETIDEKKYRQAVKQAKESGPTFGNLIQSIEDSTGLPLTAKTTGQKLVSLMSTGWGFKGGTAAQKAGAATKTALYSEAFKAGGLDDATSDLFGMIYGQFNMPWIGGTSKATKQAIEQFRSQPKEPPPGGGGGEPPPGMPPNIPPPDQPIFEAQVPEHVMLERLEPIIKAEKERINRQIPEKPLIEQRQAPREPAKYEHNERELQQNVGQTIAPTEIPDTTAASRAVRTQINRFSNNEYEGMKKAYKASRALNEVTYAERPKMALELEQYIRSIDDIPNPSKIQRDIRATAKAILKRVKFEGAVEGTEMQHPPISNQMLIEQLQANNQKINFDYMNGRPSNQYLHLNNIIQNGIEEATAPEALTTNQIARQKYVNWVTTFGNDEIMKWRNPAELAHSKLLKSIENPDQLRILEPILSRSKEGKALYDTIRRDFIQKKLRPYIKEPSKVDSLEYNELMKEFRPITTPAERNVIDAHLSMAKEGQASYQRQIESFKEAKENHASFVRNQKEMLADWKARKKDIEGKVQNLSDATILKNITSVRGLKKLEEIFPKTPEGKEAIEFLKQYAPTRLLTEGRIGTEGEVKSLHRILNNIDDRALIEHTLGKKKTQDLLDIVNHFKEVEKNAELMKSGQRAMGAMIKNVAMAGKLVPFVRGNIATIESLYNIVQRFKPAVKEADFSMIDMNLIRDIVDNKENLINP